MAQVSKKQKISFLWRDNLEVVRLRPEKSKAKAVTLRYVAFYWTYADPDRPLAGSFAIQEQRRIAEEFVYGNGGVIIAEGLYQEERHEPTRKIIPHVLNVIRYAKRNNAILIYVNSALARHWREHRFIQNIIELKHVQPMVRRPSKKLVKYFEDRRAADLKKKKKRKFLEQPIDVAAREHEPVAQRKTGLQSESKEEIRAKGLAKAQANSDRFYAKILNFISNIQPRGMRTYPELARLLNDAGLRTRYNHDWTPETVGKALTQAYRLNNISGRYTADADVPSLARWKDRLFNDPKPSED